MAIQSVHGEEVPHGISRAGVSALAETLFAIRSTGDLSTLCGLAGAYAVRAFAARDCRFLMLDPRSGALRNLDEFGTETPYGAEPGGPVEQALRDEIAVLDPGHSENGTAPRESALWHQPPGALITAPLISGGVLHGLLLVAFDHSRSFDAEDEALVQALAGTLALAFERAELQRTAAQERGRAAELERQIRDDEESSAELMSVVAHQIRSPLTAIKAYAEALLDHPPNQVAQRDRFLGVINTECDRLSWLVNDILDLARLESGKRPLRLAGLAIEPLVREAFDALTPEARGRQVQLDSDLAQGLVVEADPDLLRRLLHSLIGNAVKHAPPSDHVRLTAETRGEEWLVMVESHGSAIAPRDLSRLFERFHHSFGPPGAEGLGLGLAICQGIVAAHGGRIWAESAAEGLVRMCFTMPIRQLATPRARRIARLIAERADVRELFEGTVELVAQMADADVVSLALVDAEQGDLVIAAARGLASFDALGRRTTLRSGISGSVAAWGQPLLIGNIETDRRFERQSHPQYKTKSLMCVPLVVEGEVLGVFNATSKRGGTEFTEDDLAVLTTLIGRVGRALERVWAHAGNERVMEEALDAIRSMTRLKRDGLLGGRDVVHLTRALARELGMGSSDVDLLGYVASIHDVGMTKLTPDLDGSEPLDPAARRKLERHPEVSVEILRPFGSLARVSEVILTHHERWDGAGYPSGIAGEAIPLGSRILSVVDAFDSMVKGRPYRAPMSRDEAAQEIARCAGSQFDPGVVEVFLRLPALREGER